MKELKHLNKYFFKYKYRFLLGIAITILAQIITLYAPKLIGDSIKILEKNDLGKAAATQALLTNITLIVITTLVAGFFTFLMRQTLIVMSRHIEFDLKNEVFKQYEVLSQNFYKNNRIGDMMNRISEDVGKVRQYVGPAVMYSINTFIRFTVVIVQMYLISPQLTLYTILPLPFLSYFIFKISNMINIKSAAYQKNLSVLSTFTQEVFSGIRVVKAYGIEQTKTAEYNQLSAKSKEKNLDLVKINAMFGPLMILLIGISNLVVIYVGGVLYINGSIADIGVIAQFILYINMLTWPVASLGWVSSMVQEAEASQGRLNEFLKIQPEIVSTTEERVDIQGSISFNNVSFTYEDTQIQALKNVSFNLEAGKTMAILGKTGSGKSTILQLIPRLFDTTQGLIHLDQYPVKDLNLTHLRDQIAMVPQEAFLFSDTIANNIKFGKNDATQEEIEQAAINAYVHDNIVNFKNGYNTILGERGITLSGGQKQRVSIARALIKDAPILLLDDSLSAVDNETEEHILNNIQKLAQNKTTIIVTHRVSAAIKADLILILEDGRVLESGNHQELIQLDGYYRKLYDKQINNKK
ncbi:MAG: ABC transporter ATP-binding protein [Flavobacterium sp.]|nr:ABC transporter ATP-binding protein [Candidatus Neoflavobacterium equi]